MKVKVSAGMGVALTGPRSVDDREEASGMRGEERSKFRHITDLDTLARRARALESLGVFDEALAEWRAVLRIDPDYLPAWEASTRILRRLRAEAQRDGKAH
ncbi:MAG: hypothetical protein ACE5JN_11210 [Candidatus Methylomirabilia bacterium]